MLVAAMLCERGFRRARPFQAELDEPTASALKGSNLSTGKNLYWQ
jgi:hypothetical protein